jgi:hypothetical protein
MGQVKHLTAGGGVTGVEDGEGRRGKLGIGGAIDLVGVQLILREILVLDDWHMT